MQGLEFPTTTAVMRLILIAERCKKMHFMGEKLWWCCNYMRIMNVMMMMIMIRKMMTTSTLVWSVSPVTHTSEKLENLNFDEVNHSCCISLLVLYLSVSLCNIELTKKSERWNLHLYQITEEARISSLGNFSLQGGLLFKDCPQCIMSSRFKIGTLSRFCFGRTRLGVTFYTHASQDWDSWWYAHVRVLIFLWPWFCIFLNWWQGRYWYFISWYVTSYIFHLPSAICHKIAIR